MMPNAIIAVVKFVRGLHIFMFVILPCFFWNNNTLKLDFNLVVECDINLPSSANMLERHRSDLAPASYQVLSSL